MDESRLEPTAQAEAAREQSASAEEARSFTREDVERIVTERLARAQRDADKRIERARSEGRAEAERRARMTESERREMDDLAAREREEQLRSREAEITRRELRAGAVDALISRGLPRELEQLVNYADAEACSQSIDALEKVFRSAVQAGVDERIKRSRSPLPRTGSGEQNSMLTRMRSAAGLRDRH